MKNTIAIGLGLMLGLTAGISFADGTILSGPTDEFNDKTHVKISTSVLEANRYYDVTCTANNIHEEQYESIAIRMHSHHFPHNMGPVFVDGVRIDPDKKHIKADLPPKTHTILFRNMIIEDNSLGSHLTVKATNCDVTVNMQGIFGSFIQKCTAVPAGTSSDADVVSSS